MKVFRNWPGNLAPRVPSAYSYSKVSAPGEYEQWGYSISDNSSVVQRTKLELQPRTTLRELEDLRDLVKGLDLLEELRSNEDVGRMNDDVPDIYQKIQGT